MIIGIEVPLEAAMLLCAVCTAAGVWAGHRRAKRRQDPLHPLPRELMKPAVLAQTVDLAHRRNAVRAASRAVLHGRIDQLSAAHQVWNPDTREQVCAHVAAVLRAGVRRDDSVTLTDGEDFTMLVTGADERSGLRIANRLRRRLKKLRLPQLGAETGLTASFGVASDRLGDGNEALVRRARRAFEGAIREGADHVVPASAIEEVMLLPPPAAPAAASAA